MKPWLLAALVTLLGLGCDPTEANCRQLVTRLNASVERLRPKLVSEAGPPKEVAAAMRRFGDAVAREADALAALPLEAQELQAQRDAYVAAARRSADAATAWADALDAMEAARADGDAAKKALDASLDELEKRCEASTCYELMQRVSRPSEVPPADIPQALEELADDLGRLTTDTAAVDEVVSRHREHLRRLATAMRAMRRAEGTAEEQRKRLLAASGEEAPVVERINAICRR